jgi:ribosomal protein L16 Arg81 hydroxylase
MAYPQSFQQLTRAMDDLRNERIDVATFCSAWRTQTALLEVLPPRYTAVMEDLLGRLEAGNLFTEESCSFSRSDLLSGLDAWLAKARQALDIPQ